MKLNNFDGSSQFIHQHFQQLEDFSQFVSRKVERMQHKPIHLEKIQNLTHMILLQPFELPVKSADPIVSYLGAVRSVHQLRRHAGLKNDSLNSVLDAALKAITGMDFDTKRILVVDNLLSFQKTGLLGRYWAVKDVKGMSKTLSTYDLSPNKRERTAAFIIERELKKWPWQEIEEKWPGTIGCYVKNPIGRMWLTNQIEAQGLAVWDLVKKLFPLDRAEGFFAPYRAFSTDQILLLEKAERMAFLKGPHAIIWLAHRLKEVLQHERRETILPLFPVHLEKNAYIYERLPVSGFSCIPEEELILFLRSPIGRKWFEHNHEFRQLGDGTLFLKAYPSDSMDNFHLYNLPEALLTFDEENLYTYLKSPSGRKMAENCATGFFNHARLEKALLETYPPEEVQNFDIYFDYRADNENLYLTLHSKVVESHPDELLPYWGEGNSLRIRFYDNTGIDAGGLRRELVTVWFEAFMKSTQKMQFVHSPLGAFPRERNPGTFKKDDISSIQLGKFFAMVIQNEYLLGERFHPQWISCLHQMLCLSLGTETEHFLNQMDHSTLIAWVKEHVPGEDAFAAEQLQKIESLLKAERFEEVVSSIEFFNLLWEDDELDRAFKTKNLFLVKQEARRLWLEGLDGYIVITKEIADEIRHISNSDWAFVTKEELAFSIQGRLDADWLKERFVFNGNDPVAVELVKTTVDEWLELHREDRIALKHLLLYLTGSAGLSGTVRFELVNQQDPIVAHTCSRLAHVKNGITREELLQELDLYASGKLTGFTIA